MSTTMTARPTRRTLVRSAAWSVPVIAIAAAAPAFAASAEASSASASAALKWGPGSNKHVSWDLSITTGGRAVSSATIVFAYTPNGGGGAGTFTTLEIYSFLPSVDAGWVVTGIPAGGSTNTATATHDQSVIPANTTTTIHTDFSGSDNSSGALSATVTVTYVGGGTQALPALTTPWSQASPGNTEPAPHSAH